MEIERERAPGLIIVPADSRDERLGWRRLRELRRGRVGGVARPRNIVFPDQLKVELGGGWRRSGGGTGRNHGRGGSGLQ